MEQSGGVGTQFSVYPGVLIRVDPTDLPDYLEQRTGQLHALLTLMSDQNFDLWHPDIKSASRNLAESMGAELKHLVRMRVAGIAQGAEMASTSLRVVT